jgi:hypothetical protein
LQPVEQLVDVSVDTELGTYGKCLPACGLDVGDGGGRGRLVASVVNGDRRAVARQSQCDRSPYAS